MTYRTVTITCHTRCQQAGRWEADLGVGHSGASEASELGFFPGIWPEAFDTAGRRFYLVPGMTPDGTHFYRTRADGRDPVTLRVFND